MSRIDKKDHLMCGGRAPRRHVLPAATAGGGRACRRCPWRHVHINLIYE
jgi:hypothetical protein